MATCPYQWTAPEGEGMTDDLTTRHYCDLVLGHLDLVKETLPEELTDKLGLLAHHCHCGARHG